MTCIDYDTLKGSLKEFKGNNILLGEETNFPIFKSSFSISSFLIFLLYGRLLFIFLVIPRTILNIAAQPDPQGKHAADSCTKPAAWE